MSVVEKIHEVFIKNGKTLAFAESCTGGMLAHLITSVAGASKFFLGSVVAYSNPMKEKLLGVKSDKTHGAVSAEVASEMLHGIFSISQADFAIAVTGFVDKEKIWAALGERNKPAKIISLQLKGTRTQVIEECSHKLLESLYELFTSR